MKDDHGVFNNGILRFERMLPGPAERVWEYLTKSDKKGKWLAGGDVEPQMGGRVVLAFRHKELAEQDDPVPDRHKEYKNGEEMYGEVTRWDPPRLLSYTWDGEPGEESEVTFELVPKGNDVLLILTHRRLGDIRTNIISVSSGWHTHLGILSDVLNEKQPQGFWKVHDQVEKEYEKRIE